MSLRVEGQVKAPPGPLVFATDGSVAKRRRRNDVGQLEYLTGFGWMSTAGHFGAGWCPQPAEIAGKDRATVAELRAVWHAVGERMAAEHVTVITDSQRARELIGLWKTGHLAMPGGYLGSQRHEPRLMVLARQVARYPNNLTVAWVKGHNGHLLNEGADCMARLGCRWLVQCLRQDKVRDQARFIAEGFMADPRLLAVAA